MIERRFVSPETLARVEAERNAALALAERYGQTAMRWYDAKEAAEAERDAALAPAADEAGRLAELSALKGRLAERRKLKYSLLPEAFREEFRDQHKGDHMVDPRDIFLAEQSINALVPFLRAGSLVPATPTQSEGGDSVRLRWHAFDGVPPWAEGRDWSCETPFSWPGGPAVAFEDDTGEPLALVWWEQSSDGLGLETTFWAELPAGPQDEVITQATLAATPIQSENCPDCGGNGVVETYGGHGTVLELPCSTCSTTTPTQSEDAPHAQHLQVERAAKQSRVPALRTDTKQRSQAFRAVVNSPDVSVYGQTIHDMAEDIETLLRAGSLVPATPTQSEGGNRMAAYHLGVAAEAIERSIERAGPEFPGYGEWSIGLPFGLWPLVLAAVRATPTPPAPSRDDEETVARTICEALGLDPDDELECGPTEQADGNGGRIDSVGTRAGTNPWRYRWRRFQAPARAVLALRPAPSRDAVEAMRVDHEFKAHPSVFYDLRDGLKTFEFRKDDRGGYEVGQTICVRCYDPEIGYADEPPVFRRVTNILRPGEFGLQDGYCILALAPAETSQGAEATLLRQAIREECAKLAEGYARTSSSEDGKREGMNIARAIRKFGEPMTTMAAPFEVKKRRNAYEYKRDELLEIAEAFISGELIPVAPPEQPLHPATVDLVDRFAAALKAKLKLAQDKYGYSDNWLCDDWQAQCGEKLRQHVDKGDPLDVAAYAAFHWARGWPTAALTATQDASNLGATEWDSVPSHSVDSACEAMRVYSGREQDRDCVQEGLRAALSHEERLAMGEQSQVERIARKMAAEKMGLVKDTEGARLPDDLWQQCLPAARAALAQSTDEGR